MYISLRISLSNYREFFGTESPYANLLDAIVFPLPTYNIHGLCGYKQKDPTIYRSLPLTLEEVTSFPILLFSDVNVFQGM